MKLTATIIFVCLTTHLSAQKFNLIGESRRIIEDACLNADIVLISDKANEQLYDLNLKKSGIELYLAFEYKNGYCMAQGIIGKGSSENRYLVESFVRDHTCEFYKVLSDEKIQCDKIIAKQNGVSSDGSYTYTIWWHFAD